jgi:hypothetical protein
VIQSTGRLRYAILEGMDVRDSRGGGTPRRAKTCWSNLRYEERKTAPAFAFTVMPASVNRICFAISS